jgi:hypothetical protein
MLLILKACIQYVSALYVAEGKKKIKKLLALFTPQIDVLYHKKMLTHCLTLYCMFQSHTILLVQPGLKPETRTYSDYESVNECMEGVCKIYEEHLKRQNPNTPSITYDISQLFDFVDQLADLSCLV